MPDSEQSPDLLPQRLCCEVQLFDLCDLDSCNRKSGRFCTDNVLLNRFEKIAEDELRAPERPVYEVSDDAETDGGEYYDEDEFDIDCDDGAGDDGCDDEE
ncbi:MAG: hypothetical protein WCI45_07390 [Desulfuromonadales bacterium]